MQDKALQEFKRLFQRLKGLKKKPSKFYLDFGKQGASASKLAVVYATPTSSKTDSIGWNPFQLYGVEQAESESYANSLNKPFKVSVNTILPVFISKSKQGFTHIAGDEAYARLQSAIMAKAFILYMTEPAVVPLALFCEGLKLYRRVDNRPQTNQDGVQFLSITFENFEQFVINAYKTMMIDDKTDEEKFQAIHAERFKDITYKPVYKYQYTLKNFEYEIQDQQNKGYGFEEFYKQWVFREWPTVRMAIAEGRGIDTAEADEFVPSQRTIMRILKDLGIKLTYPKRTTKTTTNMSTNETEQNQKHSSTNTDFMRELEEQRRGVHLHELDEKIKSAEPTGNPELHTSEIEQNGSNDTDGHGRLEISIGAVGEIPQLTIKNPLGGFIIETKTINLNN